MRSASSVLGLLGGAAAGLSLLAFLLLAFLLASVLLCLAAVLIFVDRLEELL